MKTLSKGTRFALFCIGVIFVIGVVLSIKDYTEHQDLSTIWWPVIAAVLFGLILWRGARTDGRITAAALLILAAAASCQQLPSREQAAETHAAAHADTAWAVEYRHAPAPVERVGEFDQRNDVRTW